MNEHNPVNNVMWVPLEKVYANDYNPNHVATMEMQLLYISIKHDGYTMPVVTIYDNDNDRYVIVDGFHRYSIMKRHKDIYNLNNGHLPIVVIDKPITDRMASTVRHNRVRGKHSVTGMSNLVIQMLNNGLSDKQVCEELGLEKEELIRLKHITGYAKLFQNREFSKAQESDKMIEARLNNQKGVSRENCQ